MLVTLQEILRDAEERKYGVGLFNMLNLETARGILEAAEAERSPLILGVAEVHLPIIPFTYASQIMMHMAQKSTVPVCLHFDHGTRYEAILEALKAGFTSVMFDGSALPYEENIAGTKEICKAAHALGASVEAELRHVGNAQDGNGDGSQYTDPQQAVDFIAQTGVDALAVAIGTAHGQYREKPVLDISRLAQIYEATRSSATPLVLHGGSGLSDEDFRNTIENGIRKVNICTELCLAADRAYRAASTFEAGVVAAKDSVKETARARMRLFGSSGKA